MASDHCVFMKRYGDDDFIILLLIDDMLIVGHNRSKINKLKEVLSKSFVIKGGIGKTSFGYRNLS